MRRGFLVVLWLLAAWAASAQLLTSVWNNTTGDWSDGTKWDSAPVSSNDTVLVFGSSAYLASNNVANPFLLNSLVFNGATGAATNRGMSLQFISSSLGGGPQIGAAGAGQFVILNNITNLATSLTLAGNGAGVFTIAGVISGASGSLVKSDSSHFALSGANTFGGGVTVNAGTLQLSGVTAAGTGAVTLAGGTVRVGAGAYNNAVVVTGNGTLNGQFQNSTAYFGALTISNQVLRVNNQNSQIMFRGLVTLTGAPTFVLSGGTGTTGGQILSLSNAVSGTEGFTVQGGSLGLLSSNPGLAGTVTVDGSALVLGAANSLPFVTLVFTNQATLDVRAVNAYTNAPVFVVDGVLLRQLFYSATGALGSSTIQYLGGNLTLRATGAAIAGGSLLATNGTITLSVSNAFSGTLGILPGGTVILSATNAYTGSSPLVVPGGGTLTIAAGANANPASDNPIIVAGTLSVSGGSLVGITNLTLLPGSLVRFDTGGGDRWENNRTLTLSNSVVGFYLGGSETIGDLAFAGGVDLDASNSRIIINSNLVRVGRGVLRLASDNNPPGNWTTNNPTGNNDATVILNGLNAAGTALANTNGMLLINGAPAPYIILTRGRGYLAVDTTLGDTAVTFARYLVGPNGTGLVQAAWSSANLNTAVNTDLVAVTGTTALTTDRAVWGMQVRASVTGAGLTVTNLTGGVLAFNTVVFEPNLHFDDEEGIFYSLGTFTMRGRLLGTNGFTKSGTGTLVLSNDFNDLKGPVTINQGAIQFGYGNGFGNTNDIRVEYAGLLNLTTNRPGVAPLVPLGGLTGNGVVSNSTSGGFRTLALINGTTNHFSGILAGKLHLVKDGTGMQVLSGTNTYTGNTTVSNGILHVTGALTQPGPTTVGASGELRLNGVLGGTSNVTVNGRLSGNAIVNPDTTVTGTGILAPGNSPGTMIFSNSLTLQPGATLALNLDGYAPGTGYDQVIIGPNGFFNLSDGVLQIASLDPGLTNGTQFLILLDQNENSYGYGTFSNAPEGTPFELNGVWYQLDRVNFDGDAQNDLLLTLIPEPNALTLVGLGLALVVASRRRR